MGIPLIPKEAYTNVGSQKNNINLLIWDHAITLSEMHSSSRAPYAASDEETQYAFKASSNHSLKK